MLIGEARAGDINVGVAGKEVVFKAIRPQMVLDLRWPNL